MGRKRKKKSAIAENPAMTAAEFHSYWQRAYDEAIALPLTENMPIGFVGVRHLHPRQSELPSGIRNLPFFRRQIEVIEHPCPLICPHAEPGLPEHLLNDLAECYAENGEINHGQTIIWVGNQATPQSLCGFKAGNCTCHATPLRKSALVHTENFESLTWNGVTYHFTAAQRSIIETLVDAHRKGLAGVSTSTLTESSRLRDVFRHKKGVTSKMHPCWGTLIVPVEGRRGMYKLAVDVNAPTAPAFTPG